MNYNTISRIQLQIKHKRQKTIKTKKHKRQKTIKTKKQKRQKKTKKRKKKDKKNKDKICYIVDIIYNFL